MLRLLEEMRRGSADDPLWRGVRSMTAEDGERLFNSTIVEPDLLAWWRGCIVPSLRRADGEGGFRRGGACQRTDEEAQMAEGFRQHGQRRPASAPISGRTSQEVMALAIEYDVRAAVRTR